MNLYKILLELTTSFGSSGREGDVCDVAKKYLDEYFDEVIRDDLNNLCAISSDINESKPLVLLDAHIDEIGFVVTYITDDGFLKVAATGGFDRRILTAQQVVIHGKKPLMGVITSIPPHLEKDGDSMPGVDEIYIDIGYCKQRAEEMVSLGDRATIVSSAHSMLNGRFNAKSLDNRAGVTAILYALQLLKDKTPNCRLAVLFSSQEETSGAGARTAAFEISPDYAIALDVSFALTSDDKPEKCGKMGDGVMIGISPILDSGMSDKLLSIAKEKGIKHQVEVMGGKTGTNADYIAVSKSGVKTALLSIPLKYMHTPTELVDIEDIKATGELIAQYLMDFKPKKGGVQ